jgi:hypothetical protein
MDIVLIVRGRTRGLVVVQAGVITQAQFNLNSAQQTQSAPGAVSMPYGPSAIAGSWTAPAASPTELKASVIIGSDTTVEPDSYLSRVTEDTPGGPSIAFYGIPAAKVTSEFWEVWTVSGGPGDHIVDVNFSLSRRPDTDECGDLRLRETESPRRAWWMLRDAPPPAGSMSFQQDRKW